MLIVFFDKNNTANILLTKGAGMSKDKNTGKLDTVIGSETQVIGDLRVDGGLRVDGKVEGRGDISDVFLTGPKSLFKGEVRCRRAVIAGRIEGNIIASESVELQTGAEVFGDITCRGLVIQPGCFFEGRCIMVKSQVDQG